GNVNRVIFLAKKLSSLLSDMRCARVVSRPAEQRDQNGRRRGNKKWPALFQVVPANNGSRAQVQFHRTDGEAAQRQPDQFAKQMSRTRHTLHPAKAGLRYGHVLQRIKKLDW